MISKAWIILVAFLISVEGLAYTAVDSPADASIREAYEQIMALRLDDARSSIAAIDANNSTFATIHLSNYVDMVDLLVTEDEAFYKKLKYERSERIDYLEEIDSPSPYRLYVLGEIYLQWAMIKFKYQDFYSGFRDASRAYRIFKQNQEAHPDFILNQKGLGTIETLVGMVPDNLRWGIKLLSSLSGDTESGLAKLKKAHEDIGSQSIFKTEIGLIYSYLLLHYGNQKEQAWDIIEALPLDMDKPVHLYAKASTARYVGRNDLTISLLTQHNSNVSLRQFPYLTYLLGVAKLHRLDPEASVYLKRYAEYSGAIHYIKDTYMRLAWIARIHGDTQSYLDYVALIKTKGQTRINYDKAALRFAESGKAPHTQLLQARLLFDGGYYNRAETLLLDVASSKLRTDKHRLEYTYRLGRIYQAQEDHLAALKYFDDTIQAGKKDESYFACNSALQMGLIYESLGKYDLARERYKQCLTMRPSDFRYGLHLKARSGLKRI